MLRKSSSSVRIYYPKLDREKLVSLLREKARDLSREFPIRLIVLFGSYATGRYTAASDVDVLAVVSGGNKDELYHKIHDGLGISNLQLHLYTLDEYERLKGRRSPFAREAEEKGIVIFKAY